MVLATHALHRVQHLPEPPERVWPFFADAANLEALTPDFLRFRILTELPIAMRDGARLSYELRLFGLPIRWDTEITEVVSGERFVDVQRRGPYRLWEHTHTFERAPDGGTRMTDHVDYALAGGWLAEPVRRLWVAPTLERIFDHRARVAPALVSGAVRGLAPEGLAASAGPSAPAGSAALPGPRSAARPAAPAPTSTDAGRAG